MEELKIDIPKGWAIDVENSTFQCIKFKPILSWRKDRFKKIAGFEIEKGNIYEFTNRSQLCMENRNNCRDIFATEKQAKSALAMAQISQIMANDERFGGVVTDEEWENSKITKYCIRRDADYYAIYVDISLYCFLAFHTNEQCKLFLEENKQLVKDYLMID